MNELLQRHGCANVFSIPEGLKELMSDISREVLRAQPPKLYDFIANYLSALLITREHGLLAVKILDDLCDCRPTVSEHLLQIGIDKTQAHSMAEVIKTQIEGFKPEDGREKVQESEILKQILTMSVLDEEMTAKVCKVVRNAYKDYWYRKTLLQKNLKMVPEEPWEIAAQHTLELYKRTKPSMNELIRATERIQASYRGYHVRKNLLTHLKPKIKPPGPKEDLPGPPIDIAASREIDLGPLVTIKIKEDNVQAMIDDDVNKKLHLNYDPMKTIAHVEVDEFLMASAASRDPRPSSVATRAIRARMEGHETDMLSTRLAVLDEVVIEDSEDGGPQRDMRAISFGAVSSGQIVTVIPIGAADDAEEQIQDMADDVVEDISEDFSFQASDSDGSPLEDIAQVADTID